MPYVTIEQLKQRFGEDELLQLSESLVTAGELDEARLNLAISDADSEINSYLVTRYDIPLSEVPSLISRLAADIVRYYLQDDRTTEEAQTRYKQALATLKEISNGTRDLIFDTTTTTESTSIGVSSSKTKDDRVFTMSSLEGY